LHNETGRPQKAQSGTEKAQREKSFLTNEPTRLLIAWSNEGDEKALDKLIPLVQAQLHRLAQRYLSKKRPDISTDFRANVSPRA